MAKRPLKVFKTAIGFHDAYVAATSRKAALEAWGADKDLFSSGAAELVTDMKLGRAALEQPGVVIRVPRGTIAQHIAAAGKKDSRSRKARPVRDQDGGEQARPRKARKTPSRTRLDKAEAEFTRISEQYAESFRKIEDEIESLRRKREELRRRRDEELGELERRRRSEELEYMEALKEWKD